MNLGEIRDIGPHRVRLGDVSDGLHDLMQGDTANLTYIDPPWGAGAFRMFGTLAAKQGGPRPRETDFVTFMDGLFALLARYTHGYCVVEYSVRWPNFITELALANGFQVLGVATATYGRPQRPLHIHVLHNNGLRVHPEALETIEQFSLTSGGYATTACALPLIAEDEVLLDPCCGLGFSARLAKQARARFRGNEINRTRLSRTVRILE